MEKKTYGTLAEAINDLTREGYSINFNLKEDCLEYADDKMQLKPEEFEIDQIYRFEGMTDPADSNILYAISSHNHQIKGLLVNAYGVYSDTTSAKMVEKLEKG